MSSDFVGMIVDRPLQNQEKIETSRVFGPS
jgi:hypothetical protein